MRAFSGDAKQDSGKDNLTREQTLALELATKNAQLEEEKKKAAEQLKMLEQLRETLKQEQARTAELTKNTALLETRIREMFAAFDKIAQIAALGRPASQ